MRKMVEKLLWQHGIQIRVEGRTVRALFQPVTGKLERLAQRSPGPMGMESGKRYIYIGPLEPQVREDHHLRVEGREYLVRSAHQINGNDGPVYIWAICVEKGREEPWATSSWKS
jgi:hypothetical protein